MECNPAQAQRGPNAFGPTRLPFKWFYCEVSTPEELLRTRRDQAGPKPRQSVYVTGLLALNAMVIPLAEEEEMKKKKRRWQTESTKLELTRGSLYKLREARNLLKSIPGSLAGRKWGTASPHSHDEGPWQFFPFPLPPQFSWQFAFTTNTPS